MASHAEKPEPAQVIVETPTNYIKFERLLRKQYEHLFANDPEYAYSAKVSTPTGLAAKMTAGLKNGSANKYGSGIRNACRELGIPYTYKAIRAYLNS